ncbi:MAG: hypothetical protein ACRYGM_15765 [Janthinobacterium lividum]
MARGPGKSPTALAVERLAKLANAGTSPARIHRDTCAIVGAWRAQQEPDIARRWTGDLHADISTGLASAEEAQDDVDASDAGAVKQARAIVDALRAARDSLEEELARPH